MPKDKTGLDKLTDENMSDPTTPRHKRSNDDSIAVSTTRKKPQDDTPALKRSTSATSSSAAKAVNKAKSMAPPPPPPRTPSRASTKSRSLDGPTGLRVKSPQAADELINETEEKLEEDLRGIGDMPTSPSVAEIINTPNNEPTIDAGASIEEFDWVDLDQRYEASMKDLETQEHAIYEDLARLNHMFQVWAEVGHNKEADRATKRLRTRVTYVQTEEQRLREKREHYLHVVNAFKSALSLLDRN